jgi:hypothetical protein
MQDRIEERLRNLLIASPFFDEIKVFYRGEPGFVPVKLFPFVIIFLSQETEATNDEGYAESTGIRYYRYDGYISLEVLAKDTSGLMPDADRKADVPSYLLAKNFTQAAFRTILEWGGPEGHLEEDPVISFDGKERTTELRTDTITNGLSRRGDNVSNRGSFPFHLYTRRQDW